MIAAQKQMASEQSGITNGIPRENLQYRQGPPFSRPPDPRMPQRKPTPSPLQVSETNSASTTVSPNSYSNPRSPRSLRLGSGSNNSPQSPQSPRSGPSPDFEQPKSPRDRLDELIASESPSTLKDSNAVISSKASNDSATATKMQPYAQLRNVSSPLPHTGPTTISPPPSPPETDISTFPQSYKRPGDLRTVPRTSSIDSAISTVSSATSHSHKSSAETFAPNAHDLGSLINVAGSPETLIQHLLKEKSQAAAQNAQLWKLVEKQRTMILGLNADLNRAQEESQKYRQKLQEMAQTNKGMASASLARPTTASPVPSEGEAPEAKSSGRAKKPGAGTSDGVDVNNDIAVINKPEEFYKSTSTIANERSVPTIAPLQTSGLSIKSYGGAAESPSLSAPGSGANSAVSPGSFTAKRAQLQKSGQPPPLTFTEATPTSTVMDKNAAFRKLPPAPLNLKPKKGESTSGATADDQSGSEYDDDIEADELPVFERGRKKTREEDDKEREVIALRQSRSNSNKMKTSKSRSNPDLKKVAEKQAALPQAPMPSSIKALSPAPSSGGSTNMLSAPMSLAGALSSNAPQLASGTKGTTVTAGPMSPGLPMSPRPGDRPINSPTPRLPRDGPSHVASPPMSARMGAFPGLPLSPRAPKQPIPQPLLSPAANVSLLSPQSRSAAVKPAHDSSDKDIKDTRIDNDARSIRSQITENFHARNIYTGFVSDAYPDLLLPPNALPSIIVKVVSSRLKPSRHSMISPKDFQEEPVFTLGVFSRSDGSQLWQVEKSVASLPHLDHHVKMSSQFATKLPDRSLFIGHAPSKIDDRRTALEHYFETLLDTQMDEKSALVVCQFLSSQALEPSGEDANGNVSQSSSPASDPSSAQTTKEGFLTKQGKKFGGWKARYFILNEPVLRYYETQGGALLGTIKLHNSKIGKQSSHPNQSPTRNEEDVDSQYRHAFLILEPKKKDTNSHIRHVLCAESDTERDAWVKALMFYIGDTPTDGRRPGLEALGSGSKETRRHIGGHSKDSPDSETFEGLQTVSYESTTSGTKPLEAKSGDSPSPTASSIRHAAHGPIAVSGPVNGQKIEDAQNWGVKPHSAAQKEHKKSRLWGFLDKPDHVSSHSFDSSTSTLVAQPRPVASRPQFGIPLAEAVEYCSPRNVDVCLPAVVYRCLDYLEHCNASREEGIFRLSGSSTIIKALRDRFNSEGDFDFVNDGQYHDVHAIASLLKGYLRELPSSILTRDLHIEFLKVLDIPDIPTKIQAYNILVHRLPECNWTLLRALSAFLLGVTRNSDVNKMSSRNIGIVFSPTLKIPAPIFTMFLNDFETIFGDEPPDIPEATGPDLAVTEPLTPEDIRSPRKQMFSELPTPAYDQTSFPAAFQPTHQSHPIQPQRAAYEPQDLPKIPMHGSSAHETGFMPLQPSYEPQASSLNAAMMSNNPPAAVPRQLAPSSAAKKSRRESSMMLMGGGGGGQRKSSFLDLRDDTIDERGGA